MKLKLGDKIKSDRGLEGEIVRVSEDGRSVMVQLPGNGHEDAIVSLPLARIMWIAAYTTKPDPPATYCAATAR